MNDYLWIHNDGINRNKLLIPEDKQLYSIISILNEKGYCTLMYNRAKVNKIFKVSILFNQLLKEKLLVINDNTISKLKDMIDINTWSDTTIVFREDYTFKNLPKGFELIDDKLTYKLSILKDTEDIKVKSFKELDKEIKNSLKLLEEWAKKLPDK